MCGFPKLGCTCFLCNKAIGLHKNTELNKYYCICIIDIAFLRF